MSPRTAKGWRWFKWVMMMLAIAAVVKGLFWVGNPKFPDKLAEAILLLIGGTVIWGGLAFLLGWATGKSEGCKTNLSGTEGSSSSAATVMAPTPSESSLTSSTLTHTSITRLHQPVMPTQSTSISTMPQTFSFDEDAVYEVVANEMDSGKMDKGLWTRLFVELDGDEKKTKIAYIKQRAEKLMAAERNRLQELARQQDEEVLRTEKSLALHSNPTHSHRYDNDKVSLRELVDSLQLAGYQVKRNASNWTIREPLGGRVKLDSNEAMLDYAQGRVSSK
jgi:hypothetical protein